MSIVRLISVFVFLKYVFLLQDKVEFQNGGIELM